MAAQRDQGQLRELCCLMSWGGVIVGPVCGLAVPPVSLAATLSPRRPPILDAVSTIGRWVRGPLPGSEHPLGGYRRGSFPCKRDVMTELRSFQREFIKRALAPGVDVAGLSIPRGNEVLVPCVFGQSLP